MLILMTFYKKLLEYRLYISAVLFVLTIALGFTNYSGWFWFVATLTFIAIGSHLFFGPIRFIQQAIQEGDMETAEKHIKTVIFPRLLFKPIRQGFYLLKSNIAMMNKDFDSAKEFTQKSIKSKSKVMGDNSESSAYFQLGMIAAQNGNRNEAKKNLRLAIEKGALDKESKASAHLQLAGIELQSRKFSAATNHFKKAKALKPQTKEVKDQIAQLEKYIHRRG